MNKIRLFTKTLIILLVLLLANDSFSQRDVDNLELNSKLENSLDTNSFIEPYYHSSFLGLKTNLLYYGVLAPNLEVEILLNKFSLNFEYQFPWYVNSEKQYCYQFLHFGVEARYWISRQRVKNRPMPYTGAFIGLYTGLGLFDIQKPEEGIGTQGDIDFLGGISGGYTIYLNRSFNLEFSLGIGYMNSKNMEYRSYEDLLVRRKGSEFKYYGPTKAKISLIWFVNNKYYR